MAISDLDYRDDSDVSLIRRTRTGDAEAYGILHTRHVGSARALAWRMSRSASDADDLVSEGFARVLSALQRGSGPEVAFRPYLLSTIRRLAYDRTDRERREAPVEYDLDEPIGTADDPVLSGFERDTAAAAFASLPERWRLVLWHTEVEGQKPAEVAQLLGIKPNAVAALAYRAREGLRQAYLSHHTTAQPASAEECRITNDRMAAYIRGGLAAGHEERVRRHLDACDDCRAAYLELANLNTALRGVVALALLGPAASAYLAEVAAPTVPVLATGGAVAGRSAAQHLPDASVRLAVAGAQRSAWLAVAASIVGLAAVAGWFASRPGPEVVDLARGASTTETALAVDGPRDAEASAVAATNAEPVAPTTAAPVERLAPVDGRGPERPSPPPAAPVPARPAPTVPGPVPTFTSPPTTTPVTTPPPTTAPPVPTTTIPAKPAFDVTLAAAGKLVDGRVGTVVATVANTGDGDAAEVTVGLDLAPFTRRGLPDQPGWSCEATGPASMRCRTGGLASGSSRAIYVPVTAPEYAGSVAVRATATAPGVDAARVQPRNLLVEPSGMTARVATIDHGDVLSTGNSLLTCPLVLAADACDLGRQGIDVPGHPGGPNTNNNHHTMVPVDVDDDPATANSSSAPLAVPAGSQVLSATLYVGADTSAGYGGAGVAEAKEARRHAVLTGPDGSRTAIAAEQVEVVGTRFQSVADVTEVVRAAGSGTWTVGGVAAGTGADRYAGWTLVVVLRQPSAPLRSLVVLDGLSEVTADMGPVTLGVGGFVVPAGGSARASLTVAAYEGDLGTFGDSLSLVSGGQTRPAGGTVDDNVFDSSAPGPGDRNRFGYDLDAFDVREQLAAGSTAADILLGTSGDTYLPGIVIFTVDQ